MIPKLVLFLALIASFALSPVARGEIPSTYIGTWELDLVRTFSTHYKEVVALQPDKANALSEENLIAALTQQDNAPGNETFIVITDKTIKAEQKNYAQNEPIPYRVISGNSEQVLIESFPPDAEPVISTIRLVEGGLAMSQEDCSDDPDRCVRRQRAALAKLHEQTKEEMQEKLREKLRAELPGDKVPEYTVSDSSDLIGFEASINGVINLAERSASRRSVLNGPKWYYYKKRD